jgi:putative hydrolase of the HAD superfamily
MRRRPRALVIDAGVLREHPELLEFVRETRASGRRVGVAAGETDDIQEREFDAVIPAGPKPSRDFFVAACLAVAYPPDLCLFLDGATRNVEAARKAGLSAMRYGGPDDLRYIRAALTTSPDESAM